MTALQCTISLASPVALGHPWIAGEGLVAYLAAVGEYGREFLDLRAREDHEVIDLDLDLPLTETDGVRHASISFFDTDERRQEHVYKRYDEETAHLVGGPRPRGKIPTASGEFKSAKLRQPYQPATRCVLFFDGDKARLMDLFDRHFTGLGKKTSIGYGEPADVTWTTIEDDRSLVADGTAMRPIPLDTLTYASEQEHLAWKPPYHADRNHARCAPPGADVAW